MFSFLSFACGSLLSLVHRMCLSSLSPACKQMFLYLVGSVSSTFTAPNPVALSTGSCSVESSAPTFSLLFQALLLQHTAEGLTWPQITAQHRLDFCSLSELKERNLKSHTNVNFMRRLNEWISLIVWTYWKKDRQTARKKESYVVIVRWSAETGKDSTGMVRLFELNQRQEWNQQRAGR